MGHGGGETAAEVDDLAAHAAPPDLAPLARASARLAAARAALEAVNGKGGGSGGVGGECGPAAAARAEVQAAGAEVHTLRSRAAAAAAAAHWPELLLSSGGWAALGAGAEVG